MQITINSIDDARRYEEVPLRYVGDDLGELNGTEGKIIVDDEESTLFSFLHNNPEYSGGCIDDDRREGLGYAFSYNLGFNCNYTFELLGSEPEEEWTEVPLNRDTLTKLEVGQEVMVKCNSTSADWTLGIVSYVGEGRFDFATSSPLFRGSGVHYGQLKFGWCCSIRERGGSPDIDGIRIKSGVNLGDTKIMETKRQIELEITRKEGVTKFKFKVDPKIEELYKSRSTEVKESKAWPGHKFYAVPTLLSDNNYKTELRNHRLFDDYGSGFYVDGLLNIAWVRTEGGQGEIIIKENVPFAELSTLAKQTIQFLRTHFEDYFREFTIKGSVLTEF